MENPIAISPANLKLEVSSLELLEKSKIKKFIGPLIIKAHERKLKKISVLGWVDEDSLRRAAEIVTLAFSQQLDRKCALLEAEGIRFACEEHDGYSRIILPEVDVPELSEKFAAFVNEIDRGYPVQIFVGPNISILGHSDGASAIRSRFALNAEANILVMPAAGLSRSAIGQISKFTKEKKLNWLGIISIEKGMANE